MAESIDIRELNIRIEQQSAFVTNLVTGMDRVIVGQKHLVDSLLIGLLSDGNILLEGVPGLAKTLAIKTLSQLIDAKYSRIQFTPDLLPADVTGTMIYSQKDERFQVKQGPVFANFVLADEINRAPAKVQSALLEAMQEKQVTIGNQTFDLPSPFLVMATQNPIEQEGTYPLPEAQVDRFKAVVTNVMESPRHNYEHQWESNGETITAKAVRPLPAGFPLDVPVRTMRYGTLGAVAVSANAELKADIRDCGEVEVCGLVVDCDEGIGSFENITFAASGTVDVRNMPKGGVELSPTLTGCEGFSNVAGWTLTKDGGEPAAKYRMSVSGGKMRIVPVGLVLSIL